MSIWPTAHELCDNEVEHRDIVIRKLIERIGRMESVINSCRSFFKGADNCYCGIDSCECEPCFKLRTIAYDAIKKLDGEK